MTREKIIKTLENLVENIKVDACEAETYRKAIEEAYSDVPIGLRIRNIRIARGYKVKDLAKMAYTTRDQISKYESGERVPGISKLKDLCKALEISASDLLGF